MANGHAQPIAGLPLKTALPSHHPGRDVFLALALKGILLLALYLWCFSPAHRPASDADAIATALVGVPGARSIP